MPHQFVPDRLHIRNVILFLFLSGLNEPETEKRIKETYPNNAPSNFMVHKWISRFKTGDYSMEDEQRSGRPLELDLDALKDIVEEDPYLTVRDMATTLEVSHTTIERGLKSLNKVQKYGRWVPHALSDFDKDRRVDAALNLLTYHRIAN